MRAIVAILILTIFGNIQFLQMNAQACLPTRLEIGDEAQVTPGAANRIRAQSNTNAEQTGQIPAGEIITILQGPQCEDGFLWWYINYDNREGWTVEANATEYFLQPYTNGVEAIDTSPEICAMETRLQIDGYGQASSSGPSRLRDEPGINAEQVGQVDPLDVFQVIDGPICVDGFHWWQVEFDSLVGWLAEGDEDSYYVEVVAETSGLALTSTPETSLIPYTVSWNADSSRLAMATSIGVLIYDTADWLQEPSLLDDGILATDLAFSLTDPNLLVINSADTPFRFRVYSLSDEGDSIIFERELVPGPMGGERPASDFAFSRDGNQLGFGGTSYEIYDTGAWTRLDRLEIYEDAGNHFVSVSIFPSDLTANGDHGVGVIDREIVQLFDFTIPHSSSFGIADPRISTLDRGGRAQAITALNFSPDGTHVIAVDITGSIQMWDLETGNFVSFIRAENATSRSNRINDVAFHPDGETIATAESEPHGIVRVFATEELEPLTVFGADASHTIAHLVSYSPDGGTLLTVLDDMIYLLNTADYTVITQLMIWNP